MKGVQEANSYGFIFKWSKLPPSSPQIGWSLHCRDESHQALFDSTRILGQVNGYGEWFIWEGLEISLVVRAINCDVCLVLSSAWRPAVKVINSKPCESNWFYSKWLDSHDLSIMEKKYLAMWFVPVLCLSLFDQMKVVYFTMGSLAYYSKNPLSWLVTWEDFINKVVGKRSLPDQI